MAGPMQQVTPSGQQITLIHFTYPLTDDSPPQFRIACMPNMTEFHQTDYHLAYQRSNATAAVTCPACIRTEVYKKAKARGG